MEKLFFNKMIRNKITFENHFKVKVGEVKFSQMAHDFTPNTFIFGVTGDYKGKIICINKIKYLCGFESINNKPEELKNTNFSRTQLFYTLFTSVYFFVFSGGYCSECQGYNGQQEDVKFHNCTVIG